MVPGEQVIPFIEGDGTGHNISLFSQQVMDASVKKLVMKRAPTGLGEFHFIPLK